MIPVMGRLADAEAYTSSGFSLKMISDIFAEENQTHI
jgi:hypothetical protein